MKSFSRVLTMTLLLVVSVLIGFSADSAVYVSGYWRQGTYVAPHYRSAPDGNFYNNWSTKGNVNPYTGKAGTRVTPPAGYGGTANRSQQVTTPGLTGTPYYTIPSPARGMVSTMPNQTAILPTYNNDRARTTVPSVVPAVGTTPSLRQNNSLIPSLPRSRVDTSSSSTLASLDRQSRAESAERLKQLGIKVDWKAHSLLELLDWESRIEAANRLRILGMTVDWRSHPLLELLDWESRIETANRLKDQGINVNWRQHSLLELLQIELDKSNR